MRRSVYESVLPASRLCWPCYQGDHSRRHGQIGCLEGIGPRGDVICRCEIPGEYRPMPLPVMRTHSRQDRLKCSVG